jgi:hypothetical protein
MRPHRFIPALAAPMLCPAALLLTLAALAGCNQPANPSGPAPANPPAAPAQTLAFAIPAGWSILPPKAAAQSAAAQPDTTVHLADKSGACRIQFSRTASTRPLAAVAADMRTAFLKAGVTPTPEPPMSLDGAPATHLFIPFPGNTFGRVYENVYLIQSHDTLLTLITIHAARCTTDFQSTLDNFHL